MSREEGSDVHSDIAILSSRLDNVVSSQQQTQNTIERMASSMERFAEHMARREEKDDRQHEFNRRIETAQESLLERVRTLEQAHHRDSDMLAGLRKYWPFLLILALGVIALVPDFFSKVGG